MTIELVVVQPVGLLTIPINDTFGVLDASISFWLDSLDDRLELENAISEQARSLDWARRRPGRLVFPRLSHTLNLASPSHCNRMPE